MRIVGPRIHRRRVTRLAASISGLAVVAAVTLIPSLAGAQVNGVAFTSVVAGNTNGCALSSAGVLYCWGANNYHQLDDGTTTPEDAPEALNLTPQLGSSTVTSFATGNGTTCVLSSRSSVYCWGNGGQGEVGDGHFATADSPAEVSFTGTQTGSIVELVGGGTNSFCVLTSTSQIWCWGDNLDGQLGNGTNSNSDVPVLVSTSGVLSGVSINSISGSSETFCALSVAGDPFCWGNGLEGSLGNNTYSNSNVPVAVDMTPLGVGVTVTQIAPSPTHTCLLDTSDNVWCWGSNDAGVNGLGDPDGLTDPNSSYAIPQKVTGLEGAGTTLITSSSTESCALVSGGTLSCWGADPLGDGNSAGNVLSPAPITGGDIKDRTLTTVSVANYATCAIDSEQSVYCWGESNYGEIGDGTTITSVSSEEIAVGPSATQIDTVPNTPRSVAATPGDGTIAVSWIVPYSDGNAPITGYTASATLGATTLTCTTNASTFGCSIPGLANGSTYTVSVVATNTNGNSLASGAGAITLPTVPDAPILNSVLAASGQITVYWTAGASDGGLPISDFTASATYESVTQTCMGQPTDTSCTITGLANGTGYNVSVEATNADGNSPPSSTIVATPGIAPGVPQNVSATAGNASIAVLWSAPSSDGDTPITGYTATATAGSSSVTCHGGASASGCSITGLTNGTAYSVTVVATNQAGNSSAVGIGSFTPLADPDAPTLVSATGGNGQIVVVWTAGASNGGEALTSFTAAAKLNATSTTCGGTGSSTTCTITGLTNGSSYAVSVIATSPFGSSLASNVLNATPATVPSAPTITTVTPATGAVTVAWSAPTSDGGASISGYKVTASPGGATCTSTGVSCAITKLTATTAYTFSVVATNAKGNSAPATTIAVYPVSAKVLTIELANNVYSMKQSFAAIVVGGTPGVVTTVTLPNATTQKCTLDALGQCAVTLTEPKVGQYRIVAKAGSASAGLSIDVPQLIVPSTISKGKATTVRVYYCPSGSKVTVVVAGKSYVAKAAGTGIAGVTITITKTGTFTIVTTVNTTTISPNKSVKVH